MEPINIDASKLENMGLDEAFQSWLSTVVDTVNSDLDTIEGRLNYLLSFSAQPTPINLTRADTSPASNITLSKDFIDFLGNLIDKVNNLEQKIKVLGG